MVKNLRQWSRLAAVGLAILTLVAAVACGDDGGNKAAGTAAPTAAGTTGAVAQIDPKVLERAYGRADIKVDPIVLEAFARASSPLSQADKDLALKCWKDNSCDTGRGKLTIAYADGFGENVWRQVTKMEFILQSLSYPDIKKIIYTTAHANTQEAIANVQSLITQKVDIIIMFADAGEAMLPVTKQATKAGIIVVVSTSPPGGKPGEDYTSLVAEDLCELGNATADTAIKQTGGKGNVVELGGTPGNLLSSTWQGCADKKFSQAGMKVLGKADTNWTQEGAFQAMSAFLAKEPKIDVIGYEYADGFRGAIRAYEAAKRPLDFTLVVRTDEQGLFRDWIRLKKDNPNFKIFIGNAGNHASRVAVTTAMKKKEGEAVPAAVVLPMNFREVQESMYNPDLPDEISISTLVPLEVLKAMFKK